MLMLKKLQPEENWKEILKIFIQKKTISLIDLMSNGLYTVRACFCDCCPLLRPAPAQARLPLLYKVSMIMTCKKKQQKKISKTKTFLGHSTSWRIRRTSHQLYNNVEWLQEWIWRSVRRVLVWQWLHPQDQQSGSCRSQSRAGRLWKCDGHCRVFDL